jgi:hypothetical protein
MILMRWTSWAFLAFVGSLVFLVLFIKDWEIKTGVDRLSRMHVSPQSALDADPDLKLVSERSPYSGPNADTRADPRSGRAGNADTVAPHAGSTPGEWACAPFLSGQTERAPDHGTPRKTAYLRPVTFLQQKMAQGKHHVQMHKAACSNAGSPKRRAPPPLEEDLGGGDICSLQEQPQRTMASLY